MEYWKKDMENTIAKSTLSRLSYNEVNISHFVWLLVYLVYGLCSACQVY